MILGGNTSKSFYMSSKEMLCIHCVAHCHQCCSPPFRHTPPATTSVWFMSFASGHCLDHSSKRIPVRGLKSSAWPSGFKLWDNTCLSAGFDPRVAWTTIFGP